MTELSRSPLRQAEIISNFPPGAGLAQLVEHLICNQGVTGSNPVTGTNIFKGLAVIR